MIDISLDEDTWYEECVCDHGVVYGGDNGEFTYICPRCDGAEYVRHDHQDLTIPVD